MHYFPSVAVWLPFGSDEFSRSPCYPNRKPTHAFARRRGLAANFYWRKRSVPASPAVRSDCNESARNAYGRRDGFAWSDGLLKIEPPTYRENSSSFHGSAN